MDNTFAIIATFRNGKFDDAYVCASIVAKWHRESLELAGFTVRVRRGFKTEHAAYKAIEREYPI